MWPSSSSSSSRVAGPSSVPPPPLGYGLPPELGMFVVTPAAAFHHHHHHHNHTDPSSLIPSADLAASTALGVGVIPLLTAAPCLNNNNNHNTAGGARIDDGDFRGLGGGARSIHLWQAQDHQHQQEVNYLNSKGGSISFDQHTAPDNLLDGASGGIGIGAGGLSSGAIGGAGPAMTCQDCGNQAKKDCSHRRCRTCCRSRGFDCSTHVRSTWVPAARRRERQMLSSSSKGGGGDRTSSGSTSGAKKPRLITSQNTTTTSHTSISNTPPRSYDTTSSHQDPNLKDTLPGQVCAPAVFKCVRVTAVEDGGEDEYAYQAVVRIGGHIFKGFLYDQGVESRGGGAAGGGDGNFPNLSELHLGGGRNGGGASSSSPLIDPTTTDVYGAGSVTGLGGADFGNTMT